MCLEIELANSKGICVGWANAKSTLSCVGLTHIP